MDVTVSGSTEAGKIATIGYSLTGRAGERYQAIDGRDSSGRAIALPKPKAVIRDPRGATIAELTMEPG